MLNMDRAEQKSGSATDKGDRDNKDKDAPPKVTFFDSYSQAIFGVRHICGWVRMERRNTGAG